MTKKEKAERDDARLKKLGNALRELRQKADMTIREAADLTGLSTRTIQNSEAGKSIEITTLLQLANCYNYAIEIIYDYDIELIMANRKNVYII